MKRLWYIVLAILFLMGKGLTDSAKADNSGKVVIVVMDRIGWTDIYRADTPGINRLAEVGAIGLMTTNTAGSYSQSNAYVTMGTGARVTGSSRSHLAFSVHDVYQGKVAGDLYFQITGRAAEDGALLNLGIAGVIRNNKKRPYSLHIGALGTVLRDAGRRVAVLGNCDTDEEPRRYLVSMMMDDSGVVPLGKVDNSLLVEDRGRPFGIKTNYENMKKYFLMFYKNADVIAIQLGDTSRVEDFRYSATDEVLEVYRQRAVEEGDAFIEWLINRLDLKRDLIILITPLGPARELKENNRLTPVIVAGRGIKRGWLTSGSTHREGIITNLDVGATVLRFFGLLPIPGQLGCPVYTVETSKGIEELINLNRRLVEIFNERSFLTRGLIFLQITVLLAALVILLASRKWVDKIKPFLILLMVAPLAYLFLPLLHQPTRVGSGLVVATVAAVLTLIVHLVPGTLDRIVLSCLATVAGLVIDQWTGASLIKASPLGYDAISGARFYGIGNEYMGVLIGAACTGVAGLVERSGRKNIVKALAVLLFVVVLFTLACPRLGANVGGTIAGFAAFAITGLLILEKRIERRHLVLVASSLILLLGGMFLIDGFWAVDAQSHVGRTVVLIRQNGIREMYNIFYRKISMNLKLCRYTIWTRVFVTSLGVVVVLFYRPVGVFKAVMKRYNNLAHGLLGAVTGTVVAFAVNDSGIVAAATAMIYVGPPVVLLIIDQMQMRSECSGMIS